MLYYIRRANSAGIKAEIGEGIRLEPVCAHQRSILPRCSCILSHKRNVKYTLTLEKIHIPPVFKLGRIGCFIL